MPDVGDRVILTLTVDPADGTTSASAVATSPPPLDAAVPLTPTSNAGRDTWTAPLDLTSAGEWRIKWTVTGTGANIEYDTVYAIAQPTGRTYATLSDLAAWLGVEPPAGSYKRLVRATRKIDQLLIGSTYAVDEDGLPTDAEDIAALRDAVCAQAEWWVEIGDVSGVGVSSWWKPVSTKATAPPRPQQLAKDNPAQQQYAPAVAEILQQAGLLPNRVIIYG
jgi:hypothetical protein